MTEQQWHRVRDLFERAVDLEPADFDAWLDREAAAEPVVRAEVASLLKHHTRAGSFLLNPITDRMPELLADDRALEPGRVVGSYTIVRELGRGGMGRVYLATDTRLGRTVALKALPPRLARSAAQRERLRREARAAAALTHPGICTIYALDEIDGDLFIAAEFIDGRTLREEIAERRRPAAGDVLQTAREVAAALASAHARGITHRDLKPENVMRSRDGRLKILDFGLARLDESPLPAAAGVTQPGTLVGTPAYMAPEQLNGQQADARADVFAFGVLLYEFACGTHPFDAPTMLGVAARVLESDAQPIERRCPDLPPQVVAVVERCLRKSTADRYQSAVDIVQALSREEGSPGRGRVATWWRTHQIVVIALYFLASVLAWQIKEWQPGITNAIFLVLSVAATVGGVFRGHLLFTERVTATGFDAERRRATPVTRAVDLLISLGLMVDGVVMTSSRPLAAVLTMALAVGIVLAKLLVEPATTAAAFGGDDEPRTRS